MSPCEPVAADLVVCETQQPSEGFGLAAASANRNLLRLHQRYPDTFASAVSDDVTPSAASQ